MSENGHVGQAEKAPLDDSDAADSDAGAAPSMVPVTVKFDKQDDPAATRTASPTGQHTSEPSPVPRKPTELVPASQFRDPTRYQIIGEHGRGGLGRVSRARDRDLGRDVAIKELISRNNISEVRFVREALITARLEHPSIVPVHEAGRWPDGTPFYAMKLVAGRPLRDLIAERTTVEERIGLLHHVIAVADAIAYAHGRNIIHRDLKPANVIVGDFGETVVIDWGLAKDLSVDEDTTGHVGLRAHQDADLTAAGSVLGTPAYMAPEQERGSPVDQRADVFAIGAMLWEICALKKVPPTDPRLRHRILRRAGIDRDLSTIIDKALDPDPDRRYPNAGALAADLKAFKAGARIAARSYSVFAIIAHWTRRRRALAIALMAATAVMVTSATLYIHNVTTERTRAETANSNLTLKHAELLLQTDPAAAVTALAAYRGDDKLQHRLLLTEAQGRGAARATLTPHSDTVWIMVGEQSGEVISLGADRRIQSTKGNTSTTLMSDVSSAVRARYSPASHLLAYATTSTGLTILNLNTRSTRQLPINTPRVLEFSPDGSKLVTIDAEGQLTSWSLNADTKVTHPRTFKGAAGLRFMTPSRVVIQDSQSIHTFSIAPTSKPDTTWHSSNITAFDARDAVIAVGTDDGQLAIMSENFEPIDRMLACRRPFNIVHFAPSSLDIIYSCRDGIAGIARYNSATRKVESIETFETHGSTVARSDSTGRYVTIADESASAYIFDIQTGLMSQYSGNSGKPTSISAPSSRFGFVLVGDSKGTIRIWNPPSNLARVVQRAFSAVYGVSFTKDNRHILTNGAEYDIRRIDLKDGIITKLVGHTGPVDATRTSPNGSTMLSYGYDGTVRVWRTQDWNTIRVFSSHSNMVEEAEYTAKGDQIVSVGDDGRLLAWSPEGEDVSVLFAHSRPLVSLEILKEPNSVVVADKAGTIWEVTLNGSRRQVRIADEATFTALRASADGRLLAVGFGTGVVKVFETQDWKIVLTTVSSGRIRQIEFDPAGRDMLVAAENGISKTGRVQLVPLSNGRKRYWSQVAFCK